MKTTPSAWLTLVAWLGLLSVAGAASPVNAAEPEKPERPAQSEPSPDRQSGPPLNGFVLGSPIVPPDKILAGGPPRDGIRSVDQPSLVPAAAASWVRGSDPVLGVAVGEESHAYPVHVIERHQVVNDVIGGVPVVVSYDPLSGTPFAHRRDLEGETLQFGVSGLIYNCNFLMYDRATNSLWSQVRGEAVAGKRVGRKLARLRVRQESLDEWRARFPDTRVLARPDPQRIDYRYSPYTTYWQSESIPFPVEATDPRFHPKEVVLGLHVNGRSRAYLGSLVTAAGGSVEDRFEGHEIRILYRSEDALFTWDVPEAVQVSDSYWFSWKAFHPDTEVWRSSEAGSAVEP